jgi:hypothetical protein
MAKFSVGQYLTFTPASDYGYGLPILKITGVSSTSYTFTIIKSISIWESQGWTTGYTKTSPFSDIDPYYQVTTYSEGPNIELDLTGLTGWLPMSPEKGPPLPQKFGIYWPWYKP